MSDIERRNVEHLLATLGPGARAEGGDCGVEWALNIMEEYLDNMKLGPISVPQAVLWHQVAREFRLAAEALLSGDPRATVADDAYWTRIQLLKQWAQECEERCPTHPSLHQRELSAN